MLNRVAIVRIDVSEECIASIIRVTKFGMLGTLAVTGNHLFSSPWKTPPLPGLVLCDEESLQAELVFLRDVFKQNCYNEGQIQSPQLPSAFRSTGQHAELSPLPALCRDYIQPKQQSAGPATSNLWACPT
jgi:hypothetical protein